MLVAQQLPGQVVTQQLVPSLRYLRRPCKGFGIVDKRKDLGRARGQHRPCSQELFSYSQTELVGQMSKRILLKPRRDKLMDKAEQVAIAHVQQLGEIPLSLRRVKN